MSCNGSHAQPPTWDCETHNGCMEGIKDTKKESFIELNNIIVPAKVGRIPYKIDSNFSLFTVVIYSQYCLNGIVPLEHYSCWKLFVNGCTIMLQPAITIQKLNKAAGGSGNF